MGTRQHALRLASKSLVVFSFMTLVVTVGCDKGTGPATTKPSSASSVKLGFVVKQPEEPWFQNEWLFAQQAADADKFELVKIGAVDGERVLAAIDNLASQGVQGFVICTPDVKLGPAIEARAKASGMKLFSVDDRLLGADGKPLTEVPHMGISAHEIGKSVGKALADEMKKRGWTAADTAALAVTYDELETARDRVAGAVEALASAGISADRIYRAPMKTTDVPGSFDAANVALTQHADVKHWLAFSMNDEGVLGAIRAMEGRGIKATDSIGVGIGGSTGAIDFAKPDATGFFASVLISPKRHGREAIENVYHWVKDGTAPPPLTLTSGTLITRDNFRESMKSEGLTPP